MMSWKTTTATRTIGVRMARCSTVASTYTDKKAFFECKSPRRGKKSDDGRGGGLAYVEIPKQKIPNQSEFRKLVTG